MVDHRKSSLKPLDEMRSSMRGKVKHAPMMSAVVRLYSKSLVLQINQINEWLLLARISLHKDFAGVAKTPQLLHVCRRFYYRETWFLTRRKTPQSTTRSIYGRSWNRATIQRSPCVAINISYAVQRAYFSTAPFSLPKPNDGNPALSLNQSQQRLDFH